MTSRAYRPRLRTDWFRVLVDLQRAGYSHIRVANVLGIPVATLRGWKSGSEPAHNYGHALLELWTEVTELQVSKRPMVFD